MRSLEPRFREFDRSPLDNLIEFLLLAIIAFSPWWFGCTDAVAEFYLTVGVSVVLLLAGARWLNGPAPHWRARKTGLFLVIGLGVIASSAIVHLVTVPALIRDLVAPGVTAWLADPLARAVVEDTGAVADASISVNAVGQGVVLFAGGSRLVLVRLGLAAGLCLVIATVPDPRRLLYRTSVLAAVLGTALALFGLAQHYGSHDQLMYWSIPVEGGLGFGPFVNRNHYPFFSNLALGLSLGLLTDRLNKFGSAWPRMIFNDAAFAWLIAAIGIMLASLVACVSRGGVLSAFLAISIVGMLRFRITEAARSVSLTALIAIPVVFLLIWVGFDIQTSRLNMLVQADRYEMDGRWYMWQAALVSVPQFFWFGSGGETYQFWETIHQIGDVAWNQSSRVSLRADNEFLDVLNEYGLVGLIGLGTIAVAACVQSVLSSRQSGLAAGGAIGTLAVVMHSCVDFGLRVPATGVFALVVVMLICAQSPTARRRSSGSRSGRSGRRSARMASPTSSSQAEFTELHESVPPAFAEPGSIGRGLSIVMALFVIVVSLGAIRIRRRYFEAENARLLAREKLVDLAYDDGLSVMERSVAATPEDAFMRMEAVRVAEFVHDQALRSSQRSSATEAILRHSRILLQQCPLDWHGYAWIAQHDRTLGSELQMDHVRKARSLHPSQPDLAFLAGQLAMDRNGVEAALPHWRDSLATSLRHLPKIHEALQGRLSADQWTTALLPMDPVVSLAAANEQQDDALRNSILEWTLELLAQPDQIIRTPSPGQWEALRGETLARLNRYDEAIAIMRRGINLQPDNVSWRLTLADWCLSQDRLDDAVREIRIVLTLDPKNGRALQLQTEVSKRKAQGGN